MRRMTAQYVVHERRKKDAGFAARKHGRKKGEAALPFSYSVCCRQKLFLEHLTLKCSKAEHGEARREDRPDGRPVGPCL